jgi:hypothetical protein
VGTYDCDHDFVDAHAAPLTGTDAARSCTRCEYVEVLIEGTWIDLDEHLRERRSLRPPRSK